MAQTTRKKGIVSAAEISLLKEKKRKYNAMISVPLHDFQHLLVTYGYLAVFVFIAIESTGIPFPGETMLLVAAIYAGTTHHLSILLVIVTAALGAIVGDNLGFFVGRVCGSRLLSCYGRSIRLDERKLKLGQYLFMKHGSKVVFFGRFVAVLRAWAAFLAGTNRMRWSSFLLFNILGGIAWATLFGLGGYFLGDNIHRLTGPVAIISIVLGAFFMIGFLVFMRRNEHRLLAEAERALPGPLNAHPLQARREQIRWQHGRSTSSSQKEIAPTQPAENKLQATHGASTGSAEPEKENTHV
jgi:membrane protein DedA with SNARE-associated domain